MPGIKQRRQRVDLLRVYNNADVYGGARGRHNAEVYGNALVHGDARLNNDVQAMGMPRVRGCDSLIGVITLTGI